MEEARKRMFFTADERIFLKELVSQYVDVVDNKKSDIVSVAMKKRKWQEIANEFNLNSEFTKRTVEQVKKCWENMKSKRKLELARKKKQRMATSGEPYPGPSTPDDSLIYASVAIEMDDVLDSDSLALVPIGDKSLYTLNNDATLDRSTQEEVNVPTETRDESQTPNEGKDVDDQIPKGEKNVRNFAIIREADKRLERYDLLEEQGKELHAFRMKEIKFKAMTAEVEYKQRMKEMELMVKEMEFRGKEIEFRALTAEAEYKQKILELEQMKEKHVIEIELLKKKLI